MRACIVPILILIFSEILGAQTGRSIVFAGVTWNVRNGTGNPADNFWSHDSTSVWVDSDGALHLKIRKVGSVWYCSEVSTIGYSNYGVYRFYVDGRPDLLDDRMVVGFFVYRDSNNEIDIEFSKWAGELGDNNAQYVLQPYSTPGHRKTFKMVLNGSWSTHSFDWQPSSITFKSYHGHYTESPGPAYDINNWTYLGTDVPKPGTRLKLYINFWMYKQTSRPDDRDGEIVVRKAEFPLLTMPPPSQPTLTLPLDNALNIPLSPILQWNSSPGAASYRLQLSTVSTFNPIVFDDAMITVASKIVGPLSSTTTYFWRVSAKNESGSSGYSAVRQFKTVSSTPVHPQVTALPDKFALHQNYPNPFSAGGGSAYGGNPASVIRYAIPTDARVLLEIVDLHGRKLSTLVDAQQKRGIYEVVFRSHDLPSGIYLYTIRAGEYRAVRRMVMMK